ncbi:MAG: orotate phosphoribosyltransferase [Candidatus Omnitrophica bacterium CG1_02_49_10]|nr:MAG: orotate phosphoribosyltransferase [Candidatus Omnitrophica bacterium CG1_02_49_10]
MDSVLNLKSRLLKLLKEHSFRRGDFKLSSGKPSTYYIDAKPVTLDSEGAYLIAKIILNMIKDDKMDAIGGMTLGADPIAGAVAAIAGEKGISFKAFIVRKESKSHGTGNLFEGPALKKGSRAVVIEDVVTTGSSSLKVIKVLRDKGIEVDKVVAVVDRLEGGRENLKDAGCELISIFTIKDFGV